MDKLGSYDKKRKFISRRTFLKLSGAIGVSGLVGFPAVIRAAKVEEIKIAVLLPFSGPAARDGETVWRGYEIAFDEINAAGGIKSLGGAKIKVIKSDTEGKPDVGLKETERVIREGALVVMGCYQSAVTFPSSQVSEQNKTPHYAPNAIADQLTDRGFRYFFRQNPSWSTYIGQMFKNMIQLNKKANINPKTIVTLYRNDLFGKSGNDAVKKAANELGFNVIAEISYPTEVTDLTVEISKVKALNPDLIIPISYISDAILIVRTMAEQKVNVTGLLATGAGFGDPAIIKNLGKLSEYILTADQWSHDLKKPGVREVNEKHIKRYGIEMAGIASSPYAGVYVVKDALERAASTDKEKIRDALAASKFTNHILPFKEISFDSKGQCIQATNVLKQIIVGTYRGVAPLEYAAFDAVWPIPKWEMRK